MRRRCIVTAALLALPGCSSEPDLIGRGQASQAGGAGFTAVDAAERCFAGRYVGRFEGEYSEQLATILKGTLAGNIDFILEQSLAGEFLEARGSTLEGTTSEGVEFFATVSGRNDCREGGFDAVMDGLFMPMNGNPVRFEGWVTGTYGEKAFSGTWDATLTEAMVPLGEGEWHADWVPDALNEP